MASNPLTQSSVPQDTSANPVTQGSAKPLDFEAPNLQPQRDALASQRVLPAQIGQAINALATPEQSSLPSYEQLIQQGEQQRQAQIQAAQTQNNALANNLNNYANQTFDKIVNGNGFADNYMNTSQMGQQKLWRQLAQQGAQQGLSEEALYNAYLKRAKDTLAGDKASAGDMKHGWKDALIPLNAAGAGINKLLGSAAGLVGQASNVLSYGTGAVVYGVENLTGNDVSYNEAVKIAQNNVIGNAAFATHKYFNNAADALLTHGASDRTRENIQEFREGVSTDSTKENLKYVAQHPLTAALTFSPDLVASVGAVGLYGRLGAAANAGRGANTSLAVDNALTYGQAVRQVGVPAAGYAVGAQYGEFSDDEGRQNSEQLLAATASGILTAATVGASSKWGGAIENFALRNRGLSTWAGKSVAARVGQAVGVEGVTEAFDEGQNTAFQVALGDKNNAKFDLANLATEQNKTTILTGAGIGGMLGVGFGGLGGGAHSIADIRASRAMINAKEAADQPTAEATEQPTAQPATQPTAEATEQPTAQPATQPTAEATEQPTAQPATQPAQAPTSTTPVTEFAEVFPTNIRAVLRDIESTLTNDAGKAGSEEYVAQQASDAISMINDLEAEGVVVDLDALNSTLTTLAQINSDPTTYFAQPQARSESTPAPAPETQAQPAVADAYVSNGRNIEGYVESSNDGTTTLYNPNQDAYFVTSDELTPSTYQAQDTVVRKKFTPTYNEGQQINAKDTTYTVESVKPIYEGGSGNAVTLIGERYNLRADNGTTTSAIYNGRDNTIRLVDSQELLDTSTPSASSANRQQGNPQLADAPIPMEQLVGQEVNYSGIEGTLQQTPEGIYQVVDATGNAVVVEGGESGQAAQELGIEPVPAKVPTVATPMTSTAIDDLHYAIASKVREAQLQERMANYREEKANEDTALDQRAELDSVQFSDQLLQLSSVVEPALFDSEFAQKHLANAVLTRNDRVIANVLEDIIYSESATNADKEIAIAYLTDQEVDNTNIDAPLNQDYEMSVLERALADRNTVVHVPMEQQSFLSRLDEDNSEALALIQQGITPDGLMNMKGQDLNTLLSASNLPRVKSAPVSVRRILILADTIRYSVESYGRAIRRAKAIFETIMPESELQRVNDSAKQLDEYAARLDSSLMITNDLIASAIESRQSDIDARVLEEAGTTQVVPSDNPSTEAVMVVDSRDADNMIADKPTEKSVSMSSVVASIRTAGNSSVYLRPTNFLSEGSRKALRADRTLDGKWNALLDIQALGMLAQPNTAIAIDAEYASQLLEAMVIARSNVDLSGEPTSTIVRPKDQARMATVVTSDVADAFTASVIEDAINKLATIPADIAIKNLKAVYDDIKIRAYYNGKAVTLIQQKSPDLSAERVMPLAAKFVELELSGETINNLRGILDNTKGKLRGLAVALANGNKDSKFDSYQAELMNKVNVLEASLARLDNEYATMRKGLEEEINSDPDLRAVGMLDLSDFAIPTGTSETATRFQNMGNADASGTLEGLIDLATSTYNLRGTTSDQLVAMARDGYEAVMSDEIQAIASLVDQEYKAPKATRKTADVKLAIVAIEPLTAQLLPYDALSDINSANDTVTKLRGLGVIDAVTGSRALEGIANYLQTGTSGFLPKSALDGDNFDGIYKSLDSYTTDENGLLSISDVREIVGDILTQVPVGQSKDRAVAEAILHATAVARLERAKQLGVTPEVLDHISYANSTPSSHPFLSAANSAIGAMIENQNLIGALDAISNEQSLTQAEQSVAKALATIAQRIIDDIKIDVNLDPNAPVYSRFNWDTYTIEFSGGTHAVPENVMHEVAHALADTLFNVNEAYLTPKQVEAKRALERLYEHAKNENAVTQYGMTGIREWLADSLSNNVQIELTKNLDTTNISWLQGIRNFYDFFVDKIRDLFGMDSLHHSRVRREAEKILKGQNYKAPQKIDEVHDALTDMLAIIHVYSKPTSTRKTGSGTNMNARADGGKPITASAVNEVGYNNVHTIKIVDKLDRFSNLVPSGFIRKISPVRYELVMHDKNAGVAYQVGTLPDLLGTLYKFGNRFDVASFVSTADTSPESSWVKPARSIGEVYVDYTPLPKFARNMIISYIDGQVEVLRKRDYARGLVGSNQMAKDMPVMLRMLTASLNALRYLRQLPTSRNSLDALDAFYDAEAKHRSDLLNDRNLHTYAQARVGEAYNYANGHTSRIEGVFKSVVDYLKDNSKGDTRYGLEMLSQYVKAQHTIERNARNEHRTPTAMRINGETKEWSGTHYKGMVGTPAAEALLDTFTDEQKRVLDAAYKIVRDEDLALTAREYQEGLITKSQYYSRLDYDYYVPLLNQVNTDSKPQTYREKTLEGRYSESANTIYSLLESMRKRQSDLVDNQINRALVDKLKELPTSGIANIKSAKVEIVYDNELGDYAHRVSPDSGFAENQFIYYTDGKPMVVELNEAHPIGAMLVADMKSQRAGLPKNKIGNALTRWSRNIQHLLAPPLVVMSASFIMKSAIWGVGLLTGNAQAAYKTSLGDAYKITGGSILGLIRNLRHIPALMGRASPDRNQSIYEMYRDIGGGMGGFNTFGQDVDRNDANVTGLRAHFDLRREQATMPDYDTTGNVLRNNSTDLLKATGHSVKGVYTTFAEWTNAIDNLIRFSSFTAALQTTGTPAMKKALADNDITALRALLDADPDYRDQLVVGSKQITGNFQERSLEPVMNNFIMFFNAGMQGVTTMTNMLTSQQGQVAALSMFAAGAGLYMLAGGSADTGADDERMYLLDMTNAQNLTFMVDGKRVQIPVDYALKPFVALGTYAAAYASGDMEAMEATGKLYEASRDSFIPLQSAQTENSAYNAVSQFVPTALRSLVLPFMGIDNFNFKFNDKPAFDEDGEIIKDPSASDKSGKFDWSSSMAKSINPYLPRELEVTPRTLESLAGNIGGDVYRLGGAATSNDPSQLSNVLTRSIFPKDNTGMFLKQKFEEQKMETSATLRRKIDMYGKNSDDTVGYQEAYDVLAAAEKDAKGMTTADGYKMGDIIRGIRQASSDEELAEWKARRAELDYNTMQVRGNAMIEAKGISNALRNNQYDSGEYLDVVDNKLNRVNNLYNDPEFKENLLKRIQ